MCFDCHRFKVTEDREVVQRLVMLTSTTPAKDRSVAIAIPVKRGKMTAPSEAALGRMIRPLNAGSHFPIVFAPQRALGHLCHDDECAKGVVQRQHETIVMAQEGEVGMAYEAIFRWIKQDQLASKCTWILTYEADIVPPPEALLALFDNVDKFDVITALVYKRTAKEYAPLAFGKDATDEAGVKPFAPELGQVYAVNAVSTAFTLFRASIFRDERLGPPWFKTVEDSHPDIPEMPLKLTCDIYLSLKLGILGYRMGLDARVLCGHYDHASGQTFYGPWGAPERVFYSAHGSDQNGTSGPAVTVQVSGPALSATDGGAQSAAP